MENAPAGLSGSAANGDCVRRPARRAWQAPPAHGSHARGRFLTLGVGRLHAIDTAIAFHWLGARPRQVIPHEDALDDLGQLGTGTHEHGTTSRTVRPHPGGT